MSGIKLSTLLADSGLFWGPGTPAGEAIVAEAKRLEALESPLPPKEIEVHESLDTDWNGGVNWAGYIPADDTFIINDCIRSRSTTSLICAAEKCSDKIRMKAIVEAYNATHGNKAVLWPLPANPDA